MRDNVADNVAVSAALVVTIVSQIVVMSEVNITLGEAATETFAWNCLPQM